MIQWFIGLAGIFFIVYGSYNFFIAINRMTGELRDSLYPILVAVPLSLVPPVIVVAHGLAGAELGDAKGVMIYAIYIAAVGLVIVGMRGFMDLVHKLLSE